MPLFEYLCSNCGSEFEKIVPTHKTRVVCETCRSRRVEKKLSVFALAGGQSESVEPFAGGGCGACGADEPGMCRM
jgi:putative FmdB family regulatory protein